MNPNKDQSRMKQNDSTELFGLFLFVYSYYKDGSQMTKECLNISLDLHHYIVGDLIKIQQSAG